MTTTITHHVPTSWLRPGDRVFTGPVDGDDFGLPLVSPWRPRRRGPGAGIEGVVREVRSTLHQAGGTVVRFTDGTKTRPVHGRTTWLEAL